MFLSIGWWKPSEIMKVPRPGVLRLGSSADQGSDADLRYISNSMKHGRINAMIVDDEDAIFLNTIVGEGVSELPYTGRWQYTATKKIKRKLNYEPYR
ncbi:MAG: hypothetical protein JXB42_12560 [Deltaproteobacteria bacterium]|nr:hypothetical protein [Deltaproteobacteria bacterium]